MRKGNTMTHVTAHVCPDRQPAEQGVTRWMIAKAPEQWVVFEPLWKDGAA